MAERTPIDRRRDIGQVTYHVDSWAGYSTERAELARFVSRHRPRGLLMLSADAHMLAIDDGTNSAGGFLVVQAGALDRRPGAKGGP